MGYAFISYSTKNQASADSVRELFRKNSIETWMAPGDIPAGSKYAMVINRAIKDCSCFVLLLTDDSQNSVWVSKEVERAVNYRKAVITIRLEDVVLNDEFEFYISTDQVVAMYKIDEASDEAQKVLAAVTAYAGQTLAAEEKAETEEAPAEKAEEKAETEEAPAEKTEEKTEEKAETEETPAEKAEETPAEAEESAEKSEADSVEADNTEKTENEEETDAPAEEEKAEETAKEQPVQVEVAEGGEKSDRKKRVPIWSKPEDFDIDFVIAGYNLNRRTGLNEIKTAGNMSKRLKKNALESIAGNSKIAEDEIVGLFDATIMSSGKSGILFLRDRFIWKYIGDSLTLRYSQIKTAEMDGIYVVVKTRDGMSFKLSEPAGARGIQSVLRYIGNRNEEIYGSESAVSTAVEAVAYANDNVEISINKFTFSAGVKAEHMAKIKGRLGVNDKEKIVAVIDTTISGNGKQGIVMTESKLYWDALKELSPLVLDKLASVEYKKQSNTFDFVYKNGKTASKIIYSSHGQLVFAALNFIITNRKD